MAGGMRGLVVAVAAAWALVPLGAPPAQAGTPSSPAAASSVSASSAPIYSGLAESLLDICSRPLTTVAGAGTVVTSATWSWLGSAELVSASARRLRATIFSVSGALPTASDRGQATTMARCMDAHPLDWSLSLSDSRHQREELYPYFRDELDPCLARHTSATPPLPTRADFLDGGLTRFDPYRYVRVYSLDAARRLQAACPPAPRDVLIAATLIAAAERR